MPIDATVLNHAFPIGLFRFTLVPRETLFVPAINKANMLRGAFGSSFRRLCCVPQCQNAQACPLASSCPYKVIFEPSPPPDADRLSRNQDVPRPFVFRAPAGNKTKFEPGEEFEFGLVLIGRGLEHLPYFVLAFRELAAQGLGLNRAKCELKRVSEGTGDREQVTGDREHFSRESQDRTRIHSEKRKISPRRPSFGPPQDRLRGTAWQSHHQNPLTTKDTRDTEENQDLTTETRRHGGYEEQMESHLRSSASGACPEASRGTVKIFDSVDQMFHAPEGLDLEKFIVERLEQMPGDRICIRFLSPTWIKAENQVVQRPEFAHIFKRLRDRINALSTFFGAGALEADFAGLGKRSEQVRTVSCNVRWEERFRTSSKTHQRHELSGFTGEAVYEGQLEEFLPWLVLGELVHVGKHTAWGMGEMQVTGYRLQGTGDREQEASSQKPLA